MGIDRRAHRRPRAQLRAQHHQRVPRSVKLVLAVLPTRQCPVRSTVFPLKFSTDTSFPAESDFT